MRSVLVSLLVYIAIIAIHLLICRSRFFRFTRQRQVHSLWLLGSLGAVVYWGLTAIPAVNANDFWTIPLRKSALLLYSLSLFPYYLFFTNADYDSPSQMIMRALNKRGQCSYQELLQIMIPSSLIMARLDDLRAEGFIGEKEGKYSLQAKGILLVKCMAIYKTLIGREIHG